jgi:hypothetical protein
LGIHQLPPGELPIPTSVLDPEAQGVTENAPLVGATSGRRAQRRKKSVGRYIEVADTALVETNDDVAAFEVLIDDDPYDEIGSQHPLYAYSATRDPDNMYFHEGMKARDEDEFVKAMQKGVDSHEDGNHWILMLRSKVPVRQGVPVITLERRGGRTLEAWDLHAKTQNRDYFVRRVIYYALASGSTAKQIDKPYYHCG